MVKGETEEARGALRRKIIENKLSEPVKLER
jgi:hypothetical protein